MIQRKAYYLLFLVLLTGCSFITSKHTPIRNISVQADNDANESSAIYIDILFLLDNELSNSLPLTSSEWFASKASLVNQHRSSILVLSVSIAPSTSEKLRLPDGYRKAKDVIAYASYLSKNAQGRYKVSGFKNLLITLSRTDIKLSEQ